MEFYEEFEELLKLADGPVGGFGPRYNVPQSVADAALWLGERIGLLNRLLVSGGAVGIDSIFEQGFRLSTIVDPKIFIPNWQRDGSRTAGFVRTKKAMEWIKENRGCAVIFIPQFAKKGGSLYSVRCAMEVGIPMLKLTFDYQGNIISELYNPKFELGLLFDHKEIRI